jgi:hypothetical protein
MSRRATWLFALILAVSSGSALAQAPVGRQGSPQAPAVRVERRGLEEGLIISRYRDLRSGVSVTMEGNAGQADGETWLKAANEAKKEGDFVALVGANRAKGLTGCAGVFNGIRVETRWQRK